MADEVKDVVEEIEVTEDNAEEIALKELADEKKKKDEPREEPEDTESTEDGEDKDTEDGDDSDDDDGSDDTKSDEELLEAKDEDLSDTDKEAKKLLLETKAEEAKNEEDLLLVKEDPTDDEKLSIIEIKANRETQAKESLEKQIKEYAELSGMDEEQARKDIESIHKISDKYNGDAVELSKANLNLQRLNSKKDAEIKALEEKPVQQNVDWKLTINSNKLVMDGKTHTRDEAVNKYREAYPDITDPLEDDAVVALMAKDCETISAREQVAKTGQLKTDADSKRKDLLNGLSDQEFKPVIEELISGYSPRAIMHDNFDMEQLVFWAKGQKYDALKGSIDGIKKEYFKLGQQNRKVKSVTVEGANKTKVKSGVSLTEAEQNEAWGKFPDARNDKECYEMFADLKKSRLANKK